MFESLPNTHAHRLNAKPSTEGELKAKIFALGEWYSYRGLALTANSGVSTLGFNMVGASLVLNLNATGI